MTKLDKVAQTAAADPEWGPLTKEEAVGFIEKVEGLYPLLLRLGDPPLASTLMSLRNTVNGQHGYKLKLKHYRVGSLTPVDEEPVDEE